MTDSSAFGKRFTNNELFDSVTTESDLKKYVNYLAKSNHELGKFISGYAEPNNYVGENGYLYLNLDNLKLYAKKRNKWFEISGSGYGTNIIDGTNIITGTGIPNNCLGNDSDIYIDLLSKNVYLKKNCQWGIIGNIGIYKTKAEKGEPGIKGESGIKGEKGDRGLIGSQILVENGNPNSLLGFNSDIYIDLLTSNIFKKK